MLITLQGGRASGQDSLSSSATQYHPLGTIGFDRNFRRYRYTQAGGSDLVQGKVYQAAAPIGAHLATTATATAIGATSLTFTPGATAGAANLYAEGVLQVDTTPGEGYSYGVTGHVAITASVAFTLYLAETIQVALTTSSRLGLRHNRYKNVIICPTTITAQVVGVAVYPIATTQYGWVGTGGIFSTLINGTPAVTAPVINSATVSGAVDVWTAAAQPTSNILGRMAQLGVDTKYNFVDWLLD